MSRLLERALTAAVSHPNLTRRVVGWLAITSLAVLGIRLATRNIQQWFSGQAAIGQLLNDLALAYLGAWIFNLLVVEIPRRQTGVKIIQAVAPKLRTLAADGGGLLQTLFNYSGSSEPPPWTEETVENFCKSIDPHSPAPMSALDANGSLTSVDWIFYLKDMQTRADRIQSELEPLYIYFESDLIIKLKNLRESIYSVQVRLIPPASALKRNHDLAFLAACLLEYRDLGIALNDYLDRASSS